MKLFNLIIFDQNVWNATTDYLGSFTTKEQAFTAYKKFIKKECQNKEGLVQTYDLMMDEFKNEDYSETAEALKIVISETNKLCDYTSDTDLEFNVPDLFKDVINNYEKY